MKALHHFIVRVPKRFEDTIEVGGQELYLDSKWNEFENRIAYGEIVSVPLRYGSDAKRRHSDLPSSRHNKQCS